MTTYHPIDGGLASVPDDFDDDLDLAQSRVIGEFPPPIPPRPTVLDQLAGYGHFIDRTHSLTYEFVDAYCVCFCTDHTHPASEFQQRQVWHDGESVYLTAWHTRHDAAQVDQAYAAGASHIVHRRELRVASIEEAA